jgi:hypothetical protein
LKADYYPKKSQQRPLDWEVGGDFLLVRIWVPWVLYVHHATLLHPAHHSLIVFNAARATAGLDYTHVVLIGYVTEHKRTSYTVLP